MIDAGVLPAFFAVIVLFLAPAGPDMAFMTAVGLEGGRRAAVRAILGIGSGMSLYAVAVVIGLGAVAREHPRLLDTVQVLGAVYLLWLAYTTLRNARDTQHRDSTAAAGAPYRRGLTVSLTNPKIILFYLAVLPQFIGSATSPSVQLAVLGAVNVLTEVVLYGGIGLLAGTLGARAGGTGRAGVVLHYVAAFVYLALAVVILVEVVA